MKVLFINFKKEWTFFEKSFLAAFKNFGQSGIYVLGPEVEKFEENFANYCGYKFAVGVSTGLSALEMILLAHGIGKDDEVITVANTAVATSLAISNVGAKPVFCDVGNDFLIDVNKIEALINKKTKVILPVHLFGKICNMKQINKIAKKNNLIVMEDACQAHGAKFIGESAINTKAFSFYPTKNLGAFGEGGAIITHDVLVKDFVYSYRNYGQKERYNHIIKGVNGRIDPLQCILLNIKLNHLDSFIEKRRKIAKRYIEGIENNTKIIINEYDESSAYHLFVIRVVDGRRTELREFLASKGINSLIHYPTAIHHQPCYIDEYKKVKLNNTDKFQSEILSLPCNHVLELKEIDYVINQVNLFFGKD